jgi:hypothetical protein
MVNVHYMPVEAVEHVDPRPMLVRSTAVKLVVVVSY